MYLPLTVLTDLEQLSIAIVLYTLQIKKSGWEETQLSQL
jgi:hypothetical protein